jgi:hypothetical protein
MQLKDNPVQGKERIMTHSLFNNNAPAAEVTHDKRKFQNTK